MPLGGLAETGDLDLLEVELLQQRVLLALKVHGVALGPQPNLFQPCSGAWADGIVRQAHTD